MATRDQVEELSAFHLRVIDAQLVAIHTCELYAGLPSFMEKRRALAAAALKSWAACDEARAVRGMYEREALRASFETMAASRAADLLHRWRECCNRAVEPFTTFHEENLQ